MILKKNSFKVLSASVILGLSAYSAPASAEVLTFDDLVLHGFALNLGSYHGFELGGGNDQNSWVISAKDTFPPFDGDVAHSGTQYAWSNGGVDLALRGSPFTLNSLWVRSGFAPNDNLTIAGYKAGKLVYTTTVAIDQTYQLIELGSASAVDNVTFNSAIHSNILYDDITVNAVPEPATWGMLLAGLAMLTGFVRRKKSC